MAVRYSGEDRAFFEADLEGPQWIPQRRITRRGPGGSIVLADEPVSAVFYGSKAVPVATPGRRLSVMEERSFELQRATFLPISPRKVLGLPAVFDLNQEGLQQEGVSRFMTLGQGRTTLPREWNNRRRF